jgi:phosphoenolpyruvate carboxykinase (ATP)
VWHPAKYAQLLAEKMRRHETRVWLVNTGWSGGPYGIGQRMKLSITREIVDAIHGGELANAPTHTDPTFGFKTVTRCGDIPASVLAPRDSWSDKAQYDAAAKRLARMFISNFEPYAAEAGQSIIAGGPTT